MFPSDEEEDAGGLSPAKDDDEVWREQTRKTLMNSIKEEYKTGCGDHASPPAGWGVIFLHIFEKTLFFMTKGK